MFQITEPQALWPQINVSFTLADLPIGQFPPALGTRVKAVDPAYGEADFVLLKGIGSLNVGDAVTFNPYTGAVVRTLAAAKGLVGISMSDAGSQSFQWYCVRGSVPVKSALAVVGGLGYVSAAAGSLISTAVAAQGCVAAFFGAVNGYTLPARVVNTVNGSNLIGVNSIDGLFVGMSLVGTGIVGTITAIGYGGTFTGSSGPTPYQIQMSGASTATGSPSAVPTATGFAVICLDGPNIPNAI